jgi:hypothetical protein
MNILIYSTDIYSEQENFLEYMICYHGEIIHFSELTGPIEQSEYFAEFEYTQLSHAERKVIEKQYKLGDSYRSIGRDLGRSHTTISREM